jgi:hypothetical protein
MIAARKGAAKKTTYRFPIPQAGLSFILNWVRFSVILCEIFYETERRFEKQW